jgi:RHS repeat-associated protein
MKQLLALRWLGLDRAGDFFFALRAAAAAFARRALAFGPPPGTPRPRRPRRLGLLPRVEPLETRLVPAALTGITEYAVPTTNSQPYGITLGPDNNIWFTEQFGVKIGKVTASGGFTEYALNTGYTVTGDITTGPDNNLWFSEQKTSTRAADVGRSTTSGSITDYDLGTGALTQGAGISATRGPGGSLWVVVGGNTNTIAQVTPGSPTVTTYTIPTANAAAKEITLGPDGNLWFTELGASQIGRLTPSGSFSEWATPTGSSSPWYIAAGPDGNVWFTENGANKVGRITPGGTITEFPIPTANSGPQGIVAGPDGNLWFLENTANQIGQLTPAGTFTEYSAGLTANAGLTAITVGADGNLWFTENTANQIGKFISPVSGTQLFNDPFQYKGLIFEQASISPQNGNLLVQQNLDPFHSPTAASGWGFGVAPALVYNSQSIPAQPLLELTIATDSGGTLPSSFTVQLTWNGGTPQTPVSFSTTGHSAGDTLAAAVQVANAVTSTGLYPWSATVVLHYANADTLTRTIAGSTPVVVNGSSGPYGEGWSVAGVDQLISVTGGVLWIYGSGGFRYFAALGAGSFLSPANDTGTLTQSQVDNTYTYTAKGQVKWHFSSAGLLASVTDPHNLAITYTYSGGLLQTIAGPDGGVATFSYAAGKLSAVAEPGSRTVTATVNGSGDLTGLTLPDGSLRTLAYDTNHHLTSDQHGTTSAAYSYTASTGELATAALGAGGTLTLDPANAAALATSPALNASAVFGVQIDPNGHTSTYTLDGLGRDTRTQQPGGVSWQDQRNSGGLPSQTTDPNNNVTTYQYDNRSGTEDLTQVTNADNSTEKFTYDPTFHQPTTITDGDGHTTTLTYDGTTGDLLTRTDALLHVTTYTYYQTGGISNGLVQSVTDPNGNVTSYGYDSSRRLTTMIQGYGTSAAATTAYAYDAAGNVLSVTDPDGHVTSYAYDGLRRETEEIRGYGTSAAATTVYGYDAAGDRTSVTDPDGNVTSTAYDAAGRATTVVQGYGTAAASTSTLLYDAAGNLQSETTGYSPTASYSHPSTTSYGYDALNRVTTTITGYGTSAAATVVTAYDAAGNVLSVTDPNGNVTSYGYDPLNRQVTLIEGYNTTAASTATTLYDAAGNVVARTTGYSSSTTYSHPSTTSYGYDALNRVTTVISGYGTSVATTATMQYDAAGNLLSKTTGYSPTSSYSHPSTTSYAYDALNRTTQVITAYGVSGQQRTTSAVYDAAGNAVVRYDGLGNPTTVAYDAQNRPTTVTDPLSHVTTTTYDADGNVLTVTDANNHTTSYAYDALNRRTTTTDPLSHVTTETYDAAGNRVTLKDADNNVTTFAYDAQERLTSQTDPLNHTATFAYDGDGHLTSTTDRDGRTTTYSYDALGRQIGETDAGGTVTDTLTYTYDAAGDQLTAANGQGTYTLTYDALGRVTAAQEIHAVTLTFSYDAAGNRTLVTDSLGGTTTSVYDSQDELTSRQFSGTGQAPLRIDQTYDADGRRSGQTRYADLAGTTVASTTSFTYDNASRLTDEQHKYANGTNIAHYTYTYDAANQVLTDSTDSTVTSYGYDAAGQLTAGGGTAYSYDATGNRTGTGYGTSTANELPSDPTWTYTYDNEGNLTERLGKSNGLAWTYGYDNRNHLTAAKQYNGDPAHGGTLALEVDYKYDTYGNLVERDLIQGGTTTTTRFAYDGWQSGFTPGGGAGDVAWNVFADLDNSNALQTRYVRGDAVDQLFARLAANSSQVLWELTDRQGSVRVVLDSTGTIQDRLTDDGYGNITSELNATNRGWYTWTGRMYDAVTGLQYNRARWYDPAAGRWTSQDPSGFAAGDSNLYRYVKNGPTNAFDPSGLKDVPGSPPVKAGRPVPLTQMEDLLEKLKNPNWSKNPLDFGNSGMPAVLGGALGGLGWLKPQPSKPYKLNPELTILFPGLFNFGPAFNPMGIQVPAGLVNLANIMNDAKNNPLYIHDYGPGFGRPQPQRILGEPESLLEPSNIGNIPTFDVSELASVPISKKTSLIIGFFDVPVYVDGKRLGPWNPGLSKVIPPENFLFIGLKWVPQAGYQQK